MNWYEYVCGAIFFSNLAQHAHSPFQKSLKFISDGTVAFFEHLLNMPQQASIDMKGRLAKNEIDQCPAG